MSKLSANALAEKINAHLKRFEADKTINAPNPKRGNTRPYYNAHAVASGNGRIGVRYISYQHLSYISRDEAAVYLAKLDAGFVGRHYEALREKT